MNMAHKQAGTAYAFFKSRSDPGAFKKEMPAIRELSRIPPKVELSLFSDLKKITGNDEIVAISNEAIHAGMNYSLRATYPGKNGKETATELSIFMNQTYRSSLYQDGEEFSGAIVYERSGHFANFDTDTLFLLEVMSYDANIDLQATLQLNKRAVQESEIGSTWKDDWNISVYHIKPAYMDQRGDFLVIYSGKKLVAMGGVQRVDDNTAIIKKVRTHPEYRRQGLARTVMEELEERARELGYKRLVTEVQANNSAMQLLCMKLGYRTAGDVQHDNIQFVKFAKSLSK